MFAHFIVAGTATQRYARLWKENVFSFEGRHVYYCVEIAKGLAHDAKPDDNNRVLLEHQPSNFLNSSKQQYQTRAQ